MPNFVILSAKIMKIVYLLLSLFLFSAPVRCGSEVPMTQDTVASGRLTIGAEQFENYVPGLKGKRVGLVVNNTSVVGPLSKEVHLVDTLLSQGVKIVKIFAPEHGFRGTADAGEEIKSSTDKKTGLPLVSLYGNNKKPTADQLKDLDVVIFDIQDVGARFYTYISTMHYVMEACAENKKTLIVLDRPNPNGFYVDGPVLDMKFKSFVGMHPVPIVHGMTVGEYAQMINGEGWLANKVKCSLIVVPILNYDHEMVHIIRQKPSPNLPNMTAIALYPSLCLFEGTIMSVGRGTDFPFQVFGHPHFSSKKFSFTPTSREGAKSPPLKDTLCYGIDLRDKTKDDFLKSRQINLTWLLGAYQHMADAGHAKDFFIPYFTQLAGTDQLRKQIEQGMSEEKIRESWSTGLFGFKAMRKKYLLYLDNVR
jgi:uncharacterized protein YbbC (DUF1343 family)